MKTSLSMEAGRQLAMSGRKTTSKDIWHLFDLRRPVRLLEGNRRENLVHLLAEALRETVTSRPVQEGDRDEQDH